MNHNLNGNFVRLGLVTLICFSLATFGVGSDNKTAEKFEVVKTDRSVEVKLNGKPFTTYQTTIGAKPILWPLIGPTGVEMTRSYPQTKDGKADEKKDHIHHRSFWFTHGDVNGVSFWHENDKHGTTVHKEFLKVTGGDQATISTLNDWVGPDGKKHCQDQRTYTFSTGEDKRYIDAEFVIKATYGDVVFGDTKEGSFGVRTRGSMKVDAKKGGAIVSSEGKKDAEAWGKPAAWVDYYGPVDGETVGIAILNHPKSYGFPSHWHVRNYGLFAANPFGLKAFKTGKDGKVVLKKGQSMTLRYRVILHQGDHEEAKIAAEFDRYQKQQ